EAAARDARVARPALRALRRDRDAGCARYRPALLRGHRRSADVHAVDVLRTAGDHASAAARCGRPAAGRAARRRAGSPRRSASVENGTPADAGGMTAGWRTSTIAFMSSVADLLRQIAQAEPAVLRDDVVFL